MKLNCFTTIVALIATALTVPTSRAAPVQQAYLKASNTGQYGKDVAEYPRLQSFEMHPKPGRTP